MKYETVVTFRASQDLKERISLILGGRFRTRTVFIRTAVEELLAREESRKQQSR